MNDNDLVSLLFIVLFGVVCGACGYLFSRRKHYESGYREGTADASKTIFKTAVRVATKTNTSRRWLPMPSLRALGRVRAGASPAKSIHDDTTVGISRTKMPSTSPSGEDTVVVAFPQRGEAA